MATTPVVVRGGRKKLTARQQRWLDRFTPLPPGKGINELAEKFGESYATVQRWAAFFGYPIRDRRKERPASVDWDTADWTKPNAEIGRALGISRERVRQMRQQFGIAPPITIAEHFTDFVAKSRERLHGTTVPYAIQASGLRVSIEVARGILRSHGVRSFQREPRWTTLDWRLPNKDLADIHGLSQQYVANLRFKMKSGGALWDLRGRGALDDKAYKAARMQEVRRAKQQRRAEHKSENSHPNTKDAKRPARRA